MSIPDALDAGTARQVGEALEEPGLWSLVFNDRDRTLDLDQTMAEAMQPHLRVALARRLSHYPPEAFQFAYDSFRISDLVDAGKPCPAVLARFYRFLNSPAMLDVWRTLTGDPAINYLDLQATRYRPGHFLTSHDDAVPGKHRRFAFVFSLTPVWRPDWGGLLLFTDHAGNIAEGFTPGWNTLNILQVGQDHSVSMVTPAAMSPRFSLTGWMRALPEGERPPVQAMDSPAF